MLENVHILDHQSANRSLTRANGALASSAVNAERPGRVARANSNALISGNLNAWLLMGEYTICPLTWETRLHILIAVSLGNILG